MILAQDVSLVARFLVNFARSYGNGDAFTINRRCEKAIQAVLHKRYIENTEEERMFSN